MKELTLFVSAIGLWLACIAGFVQHVITCVNEEMVALLVIGVVIPPVGTIHGWGIWLGVF